MYIYLAHPIDQAGAGFPLVSVIAHIQEAARQQQHSLFRPGQAHQLALDSTPEDMEIVARINQSAIYEANGVIAILVPGMPTLGVPAEIEMALELNRPILILTTASLRARSVQIANWVSRGANCVLIGNEGHISGINLAAELSRLPDPTRLFNSVETVSGFDPLQVRYGPHPSGSERATLSRGKYQGDAGIDLATAADASVPVGGYVMVPTGAHVAIPDGYFGLITGRSSTWAKYRCDVRQAIIDSGYRGELMIGIENRGDKQVHFECGTRVAQLVLLPVWGGKIEQVEELPQHERGEAGYGSSGQ